MDSADVTPADLLTRIFNTIVNDYPWIIDHVLATTDSRLKETLNFPRVHSSYPPPAISAVAGHTTDPLIEHLLSAANSAGITVPPTADSLSPRVPSQINVAPTEIFNSEVIDMAGVNVPSTGVTVPSGLNASSGINAPTFSIPPTEVIAPVLEISLSPTVIEYTPSHVTRSVTDRLTSASCAFNHHLATSNSYPTTIAGRVLEFQTVFPQTPTTASVNSCRPSQLPSTAQQVPPPSVQV